MLYSNENKYCVDVKENGMNVIMSMIGIFLVMIGTIFSLWSVLGTKGNYVGTVGWLDNQQEIFKKDKRKVIIGTILIVIGSLLQIVALFTNN